MVKTLRNVMINNMANLSGESLKCASSKSALKNVCSMWKMVKFIFKIFCMILTFTLCMSGIDKYLRDDDVTTIETRKYKNNKMDTFPAITLCFEERFEDAAFERLGFNITGRRYKSFLIGNHFDKTMPDIKYDDVAINISAKTISEEFHFRNGTFVQVVDNKHPNMAGWKAPYSSGSWINRRRLVKCFTREIPSVEISHVKWYIDRSIFQNGVRINHYFAAIFHYPNQILHSINTMKSKWPTKPKDENYWIYLTIRGMKVFHRRYKPNRQNCIPEYDYDTQILEKHIATVGCRAPYQQPKHDWPICTSAEKMKQTGVAIKTGYTPPCRTIKKIEFDHSELDAATAYINHLEIEGKKYPQWFGIILTIRNDEDYDIVTNKKKMDLESLVGYIGGYVGLFMGFAISDVFEMIFKGSMHVKRLYNLTTQPNGRTSIVTPSHGT